MSHAAEISIAPPESIALSAAAKRMRNHRERRRRRLRCVTVQVREREIDVLIRRGLMKADARNDVFALRDALYRHFEVTLKA